MRRASVLSLLALVALARTLAAQPLAPPRDDRAAAKPNVAAPPVLEGVVRGPDRKPIESALVIAVAGQIWGPTSLMPVAARTDAEGRFKIALRKPEPQTVRVEAEGLAARTLKNVAPGTPLAIDLARGGTIEGTVRDGDTGQPLGGVHVEARDGSAVEVRDHPGAGRVASVTDAEGRFRLEGLAAGLHTVTARAKSAGPASRSGVRLGARVELLVFPAATIAGTVRGPDGRPLAGAGVHAVATTARRIVTRAEATDAQGRFEISGLEGGDYEVVALAPGLAPAVATGVALDRRGESRVDLALLPGARVVGRLVDERERPVSGRVALVEIDGRRTPHALGDRFVAEAGADGRFELTGVPPGEDALAVMPRGHGYERVDFTARATGVVDVGDVRLEAGLVLRGRVRTSGGQPIAGANVTAFTISTGWPETRAVPFAETEADGSFVLAGLEQVTYNVMASAPGFGKADRPAEPGGGPVDLVLHPAGAVTGLVVDERSRPIGTFRVSAMPASERGTHNTPRFEEVTSEEGRFAVSDVAAGVYAITLAAADYSSTTVPGVKVEAGGSADVGTVTLRAGAVVRGSVVDDHGASVPGARVSAAGDGRDWTPFGDGPQGTTDLSGAFELRGVPAGPAVLSASHPERAAAEPVAVEVDPAKPPADVRLVLSEGGRVAGSVRRRDGTPITGAMVRVDPRQRGTRSAIVTWNGELLTGADGTFAVEHLPAGPAQVIVMSPSGPGRFEGAQTRPVEIRNGETATVEIVNREILLSGRVTRAGAAAPGLHVEARGPHFAPMPDMRFGAISAQPSGPRRMHAVTRADGTFEMLLDEAGAVVLSVSTADGRLRLPSRQVEVPDADAHTVELAFTGVPITGIVVDKDTDAPLPHAMVSAAPRPPRPGGGSSATTGLDGRFQLEAEPGDYQVDGFAPEGGYARGQLKILVGESGVSNLRLALPRGLQISGRVTDAAGRAVSGVMGFAASGRSDRRSFGFGPSLADGAFRKDGLDEGTYHLVAATDTGAFAVRTNVAAGTKDVALVLRPGGRIEVTVVTPAGEPVPGVWPRVASFEGLDLPAMGRVNASTDAQGSTVLLAPAGELVIEARRGRSIGAAPVHVAEGENAAVRITLEPGSTTAP